MTIQQISPVAFFRADDRVAFWLDTPEGWNLVEEAGRTPRPLIAASIFCSELGFDDPENPGVLVVPFDSTSLPLCTPNQKLAGCHPAFNALYGDENTPVWDGPTDRAAEAAQIFGEN